MEHREELEHKSEEPPPSYSTVVSQLGLEKLRIVSRVNVRQREITTENGEVILNLKRELLGLTSLRFNYHDMTGREIISYRPAFSFLSPRLEIYMDDQLVSQLRLKSFFTCSPTYYICDSQNRKLFKIRAPQLGQTQFISYLKDLEDRQIGTVTKKWNGIAEAIFADSIEFQVDFPEDLSVPIKTAVIGFCVMIIQDANRRRY